jgi:Uma2 family endonuclease
MSDMSVDAIGANMPANPTLDDLARMMAADPHGHRYEVSPEGALSVVPPPDNGHAVVASRLMAWLLHAGWPPDQVVQAAGVRIPGPVRPGGRIPDLTVWSRPQPLDAVWLDVDDMLVVVEIASPGSEGIDQVTKVVEYAAAGIPHYWLVARDPRRTVTLRRLRDDGSYEIAATVPLTWLLQTKPEEHGVGFGD